MRKPALLILVGICLLYDLAAQTLIQTPQFENGVGYLEYLPPGYNENPDKLYPVMVFLHGKGSRGNGSPSDLENITDEGPSNLIKNGHNMCFEVNGQEECFIVLSPQSPSGNTTWKVQLIESMMGVVHSGKYRVDPNRIYLTGLSLGAEGAWKYVKKDPETEATYDYSNTLAAMVPVAAKPLTDKACNITKNGINILAYQSDTDKTWTKKGPDLPAVIKMITRVIDCDEDEELNISLRVQHNLTHDSSYILAYDPENFTNHIDPDQSINYEEQHPELNLYQWMLLQSRDNNQPPANIAPVVDAGNDISVTLPVDSVVIAGTASDSDGEIISTTWTILGTNDLVVASSDSLQTYITGLSEGVYELVLTATDDLGASASDALTLTVYPEPTNYSWVEFYTDGTPGKWITSYATVERASNKTTEIEGNDHLEFDLKSTSATLIDWDKVVISIRAGYQQRLATVGDYLVSENSTDSWMHVDIPLSDLNFSAGKLERGVSDIQFKVIPGLDPTGFGIDEIKFTGTDSPVIWYGEDISERVSYISSHANFYLVTVHETGGAPLNSSTRLSQEEQTSEDKPNPVVVSVCDMSGRIITEKSLDDYRGPESLAIKEWNLQGLTIYRITDQNGKIETLKILIK